MSDANDTSLIPAEELTASELFHDADKMQALVKRIEGMVLPVVPDLTTVSGRKAIASLARKVASAKVVIDDAGKDMVAGIKKQSAAIDAQRKLARDKLDELRDLVRKPLTDWEAEQQRIADEEAAAARAAFEAEEKRRQEELAAREAEVARRQAELDRQEAEARQRREEEEARQRQAEREAEIAEQARKKAEQDAAEAVAAAQRQAEAAAAEAQRKIEEAAAAQRRAEQEAADAQARAERQQRQREEAERAEAERRAADVEHRRSINGAALAALVALGLTEDAAKTVITSIIAGRVPAITITY